MALERASSSDDTGIAWDNSPAYRFTMDTSSMKEDIFPKSFKTERSFLRVNDGGEPKSGPDKKLHDEQIYYFTLTNIKEIIDKEKELKEELQ